MELYKGEPPGGVPISAQAEKILQKAGDPVVRVEHVQKPSIRVFLPPKDKATGAAVVICPGGGYAILAIDHEGYKIAEWLNSQGIAGIVCKYRVSSVQPGLYPHPIPLLDARQAMRLTRQRAAEWGIDPKRVGVLGFSAGGHLASCVDTLFNLQVPGEDPEEFKKMEHKPDFAALIYPVIAFNEPFTHKGSVVNLLGNNPNAEVVRQLSTQLQVTKETPPTFLVSTGDDGAVPPLNAISFYNAMLAHHVPGALHIWEKGGHGYGMLEGRGDVTKDWPALLVKWLNERGLLKK